MKIIGRYHVTATEKRHIRDIIAKGWTFGKTKFKSYQLTETETGFDVLISTRQRDDWGRLVIKQQKATVTL